MTHYIFDVDGTLTPSRGKMDPTFAEFFEEFCDKNKVYLVTGSDKPKTIEQIGETIYNKCQKVYQCSGSEVYNGNTVCYYDTWKIDESSYNWLVDTLDESDFSIRTGNHIEQRVGMVNFSVVGRNANAEERKAYIEYEAWNGERRKIADEFNETFPHLQATIGGETGIDISKRGADKSQILRDFNRKDSITFFGDAMFEGGNDYPLKAALDKRDYYSLCIEVESWVYTYNKLKDL